MQGKVLVIGSTVADVIIHLPKLPHTGEDINVDTQQIKLGGCAHNVFRMLRLFNTPGILFSPIGQGIYGDFVARQLQKLGVEPPIPRVTARNGCCYCLVEPGGERTFLCEHGAEYRFEPSWFEALDRKGLGSAYVCGLEVEEPTGEAILDFLETMPELPLWFAPGPRIMHIDKARLGRLCRLNARWHVNQREALLVTGAQRLGEAIRELGRLTGHDVVVTLGADGALCLQKETLTHVPGYPAQVADTIGAGDAHLGAIMACLYKGQPLPQAVDTANRLAAKVVSQTGACLRKL